MAEPTLQNIFGASATQSATTLTITKADLAAVGLTASATNSAEALFTALILLAKSYLTQTNFDANTDQSVLIDFPSFNAQSLVTRNNQQYRQHVVTVNLYKPDNNAAIDPDDY
jgi:hypothetical protein